jgi:uncharacterized protein YukE
MSDTNTANPQMAELWNGPGARSWITAQAVLDQAFHGFETLLADMAAEAGAHAPCWMSAAARVPRRALLPAV